MNYEPIKTDRWLLRQKSVEPLYRFRPADDPERYFSGFTLRPSCWLDSGLYSLSDGCL